MPITYQAEDTSLPNIKQREVSKWIKETANLYDKKTDEIAYIFCSDKKILEINRQYLAHDYYTDIITFDYSEDDRISGDIFISTDTVLYNSEQFQTSFEEELLRVIIHGILHLCGLKDETQEEEKNMRLKEDEALKGLKTKLGKNDI